DACSGSGSFALGLSCAEALAPKSSAANVIAIAVGRRRVMTFTGEKDERVGTSVESSRVAAGRQERAVRRALPLEGDTGSSRCSNAGAGAGRRAAANCLQRKTRRWY